MDKILDIHNYKRQFERQVELIKDNSKISKTNKKIAIDFKDYLLSEGISVAKIGRYLLDVRKFALMLNKSFDKADEKDLRKVVAGIEQSELAPESKKCFKVMIRKLYRFIRGINERGKYPKEVEWISIAIPKNHKKLPEELLTEEEIKRLIQNCENLRDKALFSCIAESGARISEIALMQIKHVSFEEYGARLTIKGKTGTRKVLVISSMPYLQQWINDHPYNENPDSYLWYSQKNQLLSYSRISFILKKASKKAGINKRVYLHLLRHSRATLMASIMSESAMKQYFGWGQDSKMAAIYVHMSGKDTDEAILRANGIEVSTKKRESSLKPIICLKCKTKNEVTNRFCKICGMILNEEEAQKILKVDIERQQADEIMNKLIKDPEIFELMKRKLT